MDEECIDKEYTNEKYTDKRTLKDKLADIFFPPACPVCGRPLGFAEGKRYEICPPCSKKLVYIDTPKCMKCGKQLTASDKEYCYDCAKKRHEFVRGVAVYAYTDSIKQSVYRFKYNNAKEYAAFYGREAARRYAEQIAAWGIEVIIPVPLHISRLRWRGYNQAELLAQELGRQLSIFVDNKILIRSEKTTPMKFLDDRERIKNVENAFNIAGNVVKYKSVLLIDDIYTTGATLDSCAIMLKKHGAQRVYFLCLCIGKGF